MIPLDKTWRWMGLCVGTGTTTRCSISQAVTALFPSKCGIQIVLYFQYFFFFMRNDLSEGNMLQPFYH